MAQAQVSHHSFGTGLQTQYKDNTNNDAKNQPTEKTCKLQLGFVKAVLGKGCLFENVVFVAAAAAAFREGLRFLSHFRRACIEHF